MRILLKATNLNPKEMWKEEIKERKYPVIERISAGMNDDIFISYGGFWILLPSKKYCKRKLTTKNPETVLNLVRTKVSVK